MQTLYDFIVSEIPRISASGLSVSRSVPLPANSFIRLLADEESIELRDAIVDRYDDSILKDLHFVSVSIEDSIYASIVADFKKEVAVISVTTSEDVYLQYCDLQKLKTIQISNSKAFEESIGRLLNL